MQNRKPAVKNRARRAKPAGISLNDILKLIKSLLPHACIVMSLMFVVFFLIDSVNSHQGFLTNRFHKILIFALSLCSITVSAMLIGINRRIERAEYRRRVAEKKKAKKR